MKANTNWGILGCGKIAHKFAQDLVKTEGSTLYAVGSRSLDKAQDFGQKYQAKKVYGSYEELATDPQIDIVYIATPHIFHKEHSLLCMEQSKAVLCEKAFAMNAKEVGEMIAFAKAKDVFLMEALWTYFLPHYSFVLDKVQSGILGKVKSLNADFGFAADYDPRGRLFNRALGGGSLLDVGIYPIFAALSILGEPESIEASALLGPTKVDHWCQMKFQYPGDLVANLFSSIDQKTETTCTMEFEFGSILIHSRFHEPTAVTITQNGQSKKYEFPVSVHGYHFEILHCQEMLSQGRRESTLMTFERSKQLIKILDRVRSKINLTYA